MLEQVMQVCEFQDVMTERSSDYGLQSIAVYMGSDWDKPFGPNFGWERMENGPKGFKLFDGPHRPPAVRFDFDSHHNMPPNHLQFGDKDFFDRSGNEAADIFAAILTKNPLLTSERTVPYTSTNKPFSCGVNTNKPAGSFGSRIDEMGDKKASDMGPMFSFDIGKKW